MENGNSTTTEPSLPQRLRRDVEFALRRALDPSDVLPMLHRLSRTAAPDSDEAVFAHRQLAELLAEKNPWRAALYARRVVAHRPEDDRGWALLGLSQTLLGHYRFAVSAYQRALGCAPDNPWYAHNLGHLLDVALDRAGDSLRWLRAAQAGAASSGHGANSDVAASLAHALARTGQVPEAKRVLARAMRGGASKEHAALMRWLECGAPPEGDSGTPRSTRRGAGDAPKAKRLAKVARRPRSAAARAAAAAPVEEALLRALVSLPFDARQRENALTLARDAAPIGRSAEAAPSADTLAAAVAYGIVFIDAVPLTQAEVAATFRVSVSSLRGRFGELRAHLALSPGDARYATR